MAVSGDYVVSAESTRTFGRVLLHARDQHVVVDGPVANGCPGEALTPAELFLGGVTACATELVGAVARDQGIALAAVEAQMAGTIDRANAIRTDVTTFSEVTLHFDFHGVSREDAEALVEAFKHR